MQDDNAMNGTNSEIRKLKSDLARLEKEREFWHDEANRMSALLGNEKASKPINGAKQCCEIATMNGASSSLGDVSSRLYDIAVEAWGNNVVIKPEEIRDLSAEFQSRSYSFARSAMALRAGDKESVR